MVLEQFIIDADIIWDQVGKTFFENPEAKPGRIMRVQVVNAGIVEDLTGYTLNLGWTSVRDPSKFGLDAFDDVDITKGIFEIEYTSGMLTNIGPLNASLQLVPPGEGRPIESNNFKLTVKNSAINPGAIQGETSFSTLENALVEVNGWNARIDVVEQEFKDRADALDGAYPVRLTAAEQSVAAVEAQVDLLNRGLGETMSSLALLNLTYPTGDTKDHIVAGNIAEVDTLTVTAIPTVAGNITVILNGVAKTIAVDPAVQTTTDLLAALIRGATFTGWTTGGTGAVVTFTSTTAGARTVPTFSGGTIGVTASIVVTVKGENANFHRYFWNGTAWADGGAYQAIDLPSNLLSTLNIDSNNITPFLDGSVSLPDFNTLNIANPYHYSAVSYINGYASAGNGVITILRNQPNGYLFYSLAAVNDLAPGNLINFKVNIVANNSGSLAQLRFVDSLNQTIGSYVTATLNGYGDKEVLNVQVPEGTAYIQVRLDNRMATGPDLVIDKVSIWKSNTDSALKVAEAVRRIERKLIPNLFPEPEMRNLDWMNYDAYTSTTQAIELVNGKTALAMYPSPTGGNVAIGRDFDVTYTPGARVYLEFEILEAARPNAEAYLSIYLIAYNAAGVEVNRTSRDASVLGKTYTSMPLTSDIKFLRVRFDCAGTGNYYKVTNVNIYNTPLTNNRNLAIPDITVIHKMIEDKVGASGEGVLYVSLNGSDSNAGTEAYPLATLNAAVSKGAKVVYMQRGNYYNQGGSSLTSLDQFSILPWAHGNFDIVGAPDATKINIIGADKLGAWSAYNSIYQQAYAGNPYFTQVFIDKTLPLISTGTRPSPNATIWEGNDTINDLKLIPVLTVAEVEATPGTFTWNGTTIYMNPNTGVVPANTNYHVPKDDFVINATNCKRLVLEDVVAQFSMGYPMMLRDIRHLYAQNCEAGHSVRVDGWSLDDSNGYLLNCKGYKNRNDGFNIHGYGDTVIYNCDGHHNYDDGISHHDGTTGVIMGGQWYENYKGGIIPTYGCRVNVYDVVCWGQMYGVSYFSGPTYKRRDVVIEGARCHNNEYGIYVSDEYDARIYNCVLHDNFNGIGVVTTAAADIRNSVIVDNGIGVTVWQEGEVVAKDNKISDNGRGVSINDSASVTLDRNQIIYNTTYGISQAVTSELVIPKRNNLFGNAANYDAGVSAGNQAKNVSYATV